MSDAVIIEGATVEEALAAAAQRLGVSVGDLEHTILDEPGKSIFGLRGKPARVRAWLIGSEAEPAQAEDFDDTDDEVADDEDVADGANVADAEDADEEPRSNGPAGNHVVPEREELTEQEIDEIADAAVSVLKGILSSLGLQATIDEYEGDQGEIILDVVGDDLAVLIGRHGRTLDSLQTIVVAATNRRVGQRYPLVVDVEGYRSRRREKLEEMARRAAERAKRTGRPVALRPMTSFERKVIHVILRSDTQVRTESDGEEPYRKVVVSPGR